MDPKLMQILAIVLAVAGVILTILTKIFYTKKTAPRIKELNEKTYSDLTLKEMNEFKSLKKQQTLFPLLVFILFLFMAIILFFLSILIPFIKDISNIFN